MEKKVPMRFFAVTFLWTWIIPEFLGEARLALILQNVYLFPLYLFMSTSLV
jgi:hypothetical protein